MKALSKSERLRIKRAGRKRIQDADRFPCGKIKPAWSQDNIKRDQAETEKQAVAVAMDARKRIHDLDDNSQFAGYTLGRIYLDKNITDEQRKAGDEFAEVMGRYYRLTGIPFPSARAQAFGSIRGHDGDVSEDIASAARRASNTMMHLVGVLQRCKDGPQVKTTVFGVCVMDYEGMRKMPDSQLAWLKRGLDALIWDKGLRTFGE